MTIFWIDWFFWCWVMWTVCIFWRVTPLSVTSFMNIFSHSVDYLFNFYFFLIEGKFLYKVVLVSAIQQCTWVTIHLSRPSPSPVPPLLVITEARLGSLCYIATSHQLSALYMVAYICWCCFLNSSLCPSPAVSAIPFSGSPFLPCKWVHQFHFSRFRIYALIYDTCFSLCDLLCMMVVVYLLSCVQVSPSCRL